MKDFFKKNYVVLILTVINIINGFKTDNFLNILITFGLISVLIFAFISLQMPSLLYYLSEGRTPFGKNKDFEFQPIVFNSIMLIYLVTVYFFISDYNFLLSFVLFIAGFIILMISGLILHKDIQDFKSSIKIYGSVNLFYAIVLGFVGLIVFITIVELVVNKFSLESEQQLSLIFIVLFAFFVNQNHMLKKSMFKSYISSLLCLNFILAYYVIGLNPFLNIFKNAPYF